MARKAYPGGWHIWKKTGAKLLPWKTEHGYGVDRVRKGHSTLEEAEDFVALAYLVTRNKNKPLRDLLPDDPRWPLIQTLGEILAKVKANSNEYAELYSLVTADPLVRKTLYMMRSRLDGCLHLHKPEKIVAALFDKLSSTQTNFTVQQMVESRRKAKDKKNARLQTDRERQKAKANSQHVFHVGEALIKFFKPDTDIDSISVDKMEEWRAWYLVNYPKKDGSQLAASSIEGRVNIAAGYFRHAAEKGWEGKVPCKAEDVPNATETVILNFREAAGVLIALRYINPRACLAFAIELYGMLRAGESLWVRHKDIVLPDAFLRVTVPKLTSDHSKRKHRKTETLTVQIIDTLHQWICYLSEIIGEYDHLWEQVKTKNEGKTAFWKCVHKGREAAGCLRWNRKDNGRHTGASMAWVLGVQVDDIQEQMRHAFGTLVTQDRYLREMERRDAAALLIATPFYLGWIDKPFPYIVPSAQKHLGNYLKLNGDEREDHRSIIEEYIPRLRALDLEIQVALGIK